MAFVKCLACGKAVSTRATHCPICGAVSNRQSDPFVAKASHAKELYCPECKGIIEVLPGGKTARCINHGGQFQVLYMRSRPEMIVRDRAAVPDGDNCSQHPSVKAKYFCATCGTALCDTCDFPQANGDHLCSNCVIKPGTKLLPMAGPDPAALRRKCTVHTGVQAVQLCTRCGAPVCETCMFTFPGNVHLCPECATSSDKKLSGTRKKRLYWSLGLAIWCTIGMALLFSGVFDDPSMSDSDWEAIGMLFAMFVFIPGLVGMGLAISSMEKNLGNTTLVWVSVIWNVVIVIIWILLSVIGILMPDF